MNITRSSYNVPIAIGIMALGVFLLSTQKISERCFIFLVILGCAVLIIPLQFVDYTQSSIAQLHNATNLQNLLVEKEKTKRLKLQTIIGFLAVAGGVIKLVIFLLAKIHFGH